MELKRDDGGNSRKVNVLWLHKMKPAAAAALVFIYGNCIMESTLFTLDWVAGPIEGNLPEVAVATELSVNIKQQAAQG